MYKFNLSKLKGRLAEKGFKYKDLANHMNVALSTISLTFGGKRNFTITQIIEIAKLLDIRQDEIGEYFFTIEVK